MTAPDWTWELAHSAYADRPGRWHSWIDRVDLLACIAADARVRDDQASDAGLPRPRSGFLEMTQRRPAVRVRYTAVAPDGGDSDVRSRALRLALRGLRHGALRACSRRAARVRLQRGPERAPAPPWRRCPEGAEP